MRPMALSTPFLLFITMANKMSRDNRTPFGPTTPRPRRRLSLLHTDPDCVLPLAPSPDPLPFDSAQRPVTSPIRACLEQSTPTRTPAAAASLDTHHTRGGPPTVGRLIPSPHNRPPIGAAPPPPATQWSTRDFREQRDHENHWVVARSTDGWRASIARLVEGYQDNIGRGYDAAVVQPDTGCIVVQKAANREKNGYCQITYTVGRGQRGKGKEKPRGAYSIVCVLEKR